MKRRKHSKLTKTTPAASAQSPRKLSGWAKMLPLVLIAAAAAAAYGNSLAGEFVFDDHAWIEQNLGIRHLWRLWQVLFSPNAALLGGRPMVSMTLAVNYAMGGTNVWGYHAVNLAIHILAAWTLYGVMRRTLTLPCLQKRFGSFAVPLAMTISLLWVIHPLQTEAVTYIIQRTEALMGLFYLLTLYCFLRGATAEGSGVRGQGAGVSAGSSSFILHPSSFILPPVVWYVASVLACAWAWPRRK